MVSERTIDAAWGLDCYLEISGSSGAKSIRWSRTVLEEIRKTAVEQYLSIPRGGLEIGGVLFGNVSQDVVTIVSHRPLAIEYLTGPSFLLSPADEEKLAELLAGAETDPGLAGQRPVGWYHTHTRTDLTLTDTDLQLHARFFRSPEQIAAVIKPHKFDPTQVAIYTRTELTVLTPFAEFDIEPWPGVEHATTQPGVEPAPETAVTVPGMVISLEPDRTVAASKPRRKLKTRLLVAVAACCLLLAIAIGTIPDARQPEPLDALHLSIQGADDTLRIAWTHSGDGEIRAAELQIVDGAKTNTIALSAPELREGRLTYVRRTEKVEARLHVYLTDGQVRERIARFVGPIPQEREQVVASAEPLPEPQPVEPARVVEEPPAEQERRRVVVPPESRPANEVEARMDVRAPVVGSLSSPVDVTLPVMRPDVPPPRPPARTDPPPAVRRTSGRAIWTGMLARGEVLLIDGSQTSTGALTGSMPDGPAEVRVFPAELAGSGFVVHSDRESIEAPSAANGWNLTTYRNDPRRAREIVVIEQPGPENHWQKLMIRSARRPVSVIVIDWRAN